MNLPGRGAQPSSTNDTPAGGTEEIELRPVVGMSVVIDAGDGVTARGVIVDDFGDLAGTAVEIGTERTARARRWAVDVEGGHIVFVDDAELLELHPDDSTG